jgi:hypothetical protein
MPKMGWVKNNTHVPQSWGRYTVEPGSVGLIPIEAVAGLRTHPIREVTVVSDDPDQWVFKQTEHLPFNARYKQP